jgi:hypothetical protein
MPLTDNKKNSTKISTELLVLFFRNSLAEVYRELYLADLFPFGEQNRCKITANSNSPARFWKIVLKKARNYYPKGNKAHLSGKM